MITDEKIRGEKLQYDINREVAKILALSSRKIDIYEYLTFKEVLPDDVTRLIKEAKSAFSSSGKALEKQTETIKNQDEKEIKQIEGHENKLLHLISEITDVR